MVTTAERLQSITDTAEFEILAIRALKELEPTCSALVHLGVNPGGKTIRGALDGFVRVQGSSPAQYVMGAFTTTDVPGLRTKWLGSKSNTNAPAKRSTAKTRPTKPSSPKTVIGDLEKAAEAAQAIRTTSPEAKFLVHLCTNRPLTTELMTDVYAFAESRGLEVTFLEQSRLRDFLDTIPSGQWLRWKHLGIPADQVSIELLEEAAKRSQRDYEAMTLLLLDLPIISSPQIDDCYRSLREAASPSTLLLGPSGAGKSVMALCLQQRINAAAGLAFWISEDIAEGAASLAEAIDRMLRGYFPTLSAGAGHLALQKAANRHTVVIVDDVNRASSPSGLLSKVVHWPLSTLSQEGKVESAIVQIVCPVWPAHWASLKIRYEGMNWLSTRTTVPFKRPESVEYLTKALPIEAIKEIDLDQTAQLLNDEPILLAFFADTMRRAPRFHATSLAEEVIDRWCESILSETSERSGIPAEEYRGNLKLLATRMLDHLSLYPTLSEFERWMTNETLVKRNLLRLAEAGHICSLQTSPEGTRLQFRHDRLLEHFLVNALQDTLHEKLTLPETACDPYMIGYLGRALAARRVSKSLIEQIVRNAPVSLISALSMVGDADPGWTEELTQRAREWMVQGRDRWTAQRHYAISLMQATRSQAVLRITEGLPHDLRLAYARAVQGDVLSAIQVNSLEFRPATRGYFEGIMSRFLSWDRIDTIREVQNRLETVEAGSPIIGGLLSLAGYCGSDISPQAVHRCWSQSKDKVANVLPALWALLRCERAGFEPLLAEMFDVVLQIEEDPTGQKYSHRYHVMQRLGWASIHGYTASALQGLMELGRNERYTNVILGLLAEVKDPITTEFTVTAFATRSHEASEANQFDSFASTWTDYWRRWREADFDLSEQRAILEALWQDQQRLQWLRRYAMKIWAATGPSLAPLVSIESDDPIYRDAIWHRVQLGDKTIRLDQAELVPEPLIEYVAAVWNPDLQPYFERKFEDFYSDLPLDVDSNRDWNLSHALRHLPTHVAEAFLVRYWDRLSRRRVFIHAALYLATDTSLALAKEALISLPDGAMEHIESFLAVPMQGLPLIFSERRLNGLLPYIELMSGPELGFLIHYADRNGCLEWAKSNLRGELERRRLLRAADDDSERPERYAPSWMPSEAELYMELERLESGVNDYLAFDHFGERFLERGGTSKQLSALVFRWFDRSPSHARLRTLTSSVRYCGKRADLDELGKRHAAIEIPVSVLGSQIVPLVDVRFEVMRRSLE